MTALHVPRVHTGVLKDDLPPVILQRHNCDVGLLEVPKNVYRDEESGFTTWQDVRPPLGDFSSFHIQLRDGDGISSLRPHQRQATVLVERHDNIAIFAPTASAAGGGVAQRDGLAALQSGLLQFPLREETDPLSVGREEGTVRSRGPGQLRSLRLVQPPREEARYSAL